jgi:hypothetical protein
MGRTNRHHTPVWAVAVYAVISAGKILAAQGQEQELVLVYAVTVFLSFLAGLLAMARFTLIVNLLRGYPLISMAATALVAAGLFWRWVRAGRPARLEAIEREAEEEE